MQLSLSITTIENPQTDSGWKAQESQWRSPPLAGAVGFRLLKVAKGQKLYGLNLSNGAERETS
jgi:hypothetical protein